MNIKYTFSRNQVYAVGYTCHDGSNGKCLATNVVNQIPWGFNPASPATSSGILSVPYYTKTEMGNPQPYDEYMFTWFFSPGYRPKYWLVSNPLECPTGMTNCIYPDDFGGATSPNLVFNKVASCIAEVGNLQYSNNIYNDQPLVVAVPANLNVDTSAAFGCVDCSVLYYPTAYRDYFSVATNVILTINSVSGSGPYSQTISKNIFWDSTESVQFSPWTPSANGVYTISVTSHVTDDQCSSVTDDQTSNTVTVWSHYPKNECWTDLNGLQILDQGSTKVVGQPITIRFQKRSQYAPNYDPWQTEYTSLKKKVPTNVKIYLGSGSNWVLQRSQIISNSGSWGDYEPIDTQFTPTQVGTLQVRVDGIASDSSCTGKTNPPVSAYVDIDIKECSNGQTRACYSGPTGTSNIGECRAGAQTCSNNQWGACSGERTPAAEICDTKDNDCDSQTDENNVCTDFPYFCNIDGDSYFSSSVSDTCIGAGCIPQSCQAAAGNDCNDNDPLINPGETEACTDSGFVDEDCNGFANCYDSACTNVFKDIFNPCTGGCPAGYIDLDQNPVNGCEYECTRTSGSLEFCDGKDNDCNGVVDENIPNRACSDNIMAVGVCKDSYAVCQSGTFVCIMGGHYEQQPESTCDGLDNDCDGSTDESITKSSNEKGICSKNKLLCIDGTYVDSPDNTEPMTEICSNNVDDNCDGNVDESCLCAPGSNKKCGDLETGECSFGKQYCGTDGLWGICDAIGPVPEICDGKDNNCNGNTDELASCCSSGDIKTCANDDTCPGIPGKSACSNHLWQDCKAECPQSIVGIKLISPEAGRTYYTCDDYIYKRVEFSASDKCSYKTQYMKDYIGLDSGDRVKFREGINILTIKCSAAIKEITFTVAKNQICNKIVANESTDELIDFFNSEAALTQTEQQNALTTAESTEQELKFTYEGNNTVISHKISSKNELSDVEVKLYLPKECLAELKKIDFDLSNYTIIKEDPLIAWHFTDVKDGIDLSYRVNGQLSEDCIEKIRLLPIAQSVGKKISGSGSNLDKFLIPGLIAAIIIAAGIYVQRFHPSVVKFSEEQYEKKAIEKGRMRLVDEVKSMNFKTGQQRITYMKERGYSDEEVEWVLKKI